LSRPRSEFSIGFIPVRNGCAPTAQKLRGTHANDSWWCYANPMFFADWQALAQWYPDCRSDDAAKTALEPPMERTR